MEFNVQFSKLFFAIIWKHQIKIILDNNQYLLGTLYEWQAVYDSLYKLAPWTFPTIQRDRFYRCYRSQMRTSKHSQAPCRNEEAGKGWRWDSYYGNLAPASYSQPEKVHRSHWSVYSFLFKHNIILPLYRLFMELYRAFLTWECGHCTFIRLNIYP